MLIHKQPVALDKIIKINHAKSFDFTSAIAQNIIGHPRKDVNAKLLTKARKGVE